MKKIGTENCLRRLSTLTARIRKFLASALMLPLLGASMIGAPARAPRITLVYTTAETSTSAAVIWNTNTASDSLVQYSTSNPVPVSAPQIYVATQVSYHEILLSGLTPATLYYYRVTSCAKKGCVTANGTFETFPSCPDVVPPVSGNWQKIDSLNVGVVSPVKNELLSVAVLSETDVWTVGWAQDPNGPSWLKRTLIQHFDGSLWSIVPSPNPAGDVISKLHSVSAASANDVWAVGSSHNGSAPARTLIQHWDGTRWSIIPSPSPDSQLNELYGVAALSANNAWAVGYRGGSQNSTPLETLILHWDGTSWRQVPSPSVPSGANQLSGIAAISANDIWAVGSAGGAPLAMNWNGSEWRVIPIQAGGGLSSERFTAVSGIASNDVWAVSQGKGVFTNQTFARIRHWDGKRWTEKLCRAASASNPPADYEGGGPDAFFTGVAAAASNDVWAVGASGSGPIILHWNGAAWTTVTHPRAFPNTAVLQGVATSKGGTAWSVGLEIVFDSSGSVEPDRTLIFKYTP